MSVGISERGVAYVGVSPSEGGVVFVSLYPNLDVYNKF